VLLHCDVKALPLLPFGSFREFSPTLSAASAPPRSLPLVRARPAVSHETASPSRKLAHPHSFVTLRRDSSARRRSLRVTQSVTSQGSNSIHGARVVPPLSTPKGRQRFLSSSSESGRDSSRDSLHLQPIENDRFPATRFTFCIPRKGPTATCPPMRFSSPSAYEAREVHQTSGFAYPTVFRLQDFSPS
jgi:hypothetical protein